MPILQTKIGFLNKKCFFKQIIFSDFFNKHLTHSSVITSMNHCTFLNINIYITKYLFHLNISNASWCLNRVKHLFLND